jgi:hypothetical protein
MLNLTFNESEKKDDAEKKEELISPKLTTPKNENPSLRILKQHKQIQGLTQELAEERKKLALLTEKQNAKDLLFFQILNHIYLMTQKTTEKFIGFEPLETKIEIFVEFKKIMNDVLLNMMQFLKENNESIKNKENFECDLKKKAEEIFGGDMSVWAKKIDIFNEQEELIRKLIQEQADDKKEVLYIYFQKKF